jgi:hypothetical protein
MAFLALSVVLFMFVTLFFAFEKKESRFLACLLYLAAFGSGIIMGYSPTVFASGSRPFFLANIILLMLCMMLISEGINHKNPNVSNAFKGKAIVSKLLISLVSLIAVYTAILYIFIYATEYYWWF